VVVSATSGTWGGTRSRGEPGDGRGHLARTRPAPRPSHDVQVRARHGCPCLRLSSLSTPSLTETVHVGRRFETSARGRAAQISVTGGPPVRFLCGLRRAASWKFFLSFIAGCKAMYVCGRILPSSRSPPPRGIRSDYAPPRVSR